VDVAVSSGAVRVQRADGLVTVTLTRPERRNAMTDEMWVDLRAAVASLTGEDRVLVLAAEGPAFCAGTDLRDLLARPEPLDGRIDSMNKTLLALVNAPVATIARVQGPAVGAGANLALLCDFVVASDSAYFCEIFVQRGLSLDSGASWLLPRLVGHRRAAELALLGDRVTAHQARELGLITAVARAAELDATVAALAGRLVGYSRAAITGTKRLLADAWEYPLAEMLDREKANQLAVLSGSEARAAINDFLVPSPPAASAGTPHADNRSENE
jgi:2-(1,2-epoxy-1,2-dihydrophenyl)acetyl-CoA isomerase